MKYRSFLVKFTVNNIAIEIELQFKEPMDEETFKKFLPQAYLRIDSINQFKLHSVEKIMTMEKK